MTYEELQNLDDIILQSSFTSLTEFKSEQSSEVNHNNTIPLDDLGQSILKKCILGCNQIFHDFNKELKNISPNLCVIRIEDTDNNGISDNLAVVFGTSKDNFELNLWNKVTKLIEDYENSRLKLSKFKISEIFKIEEIYMKIIEKLLNLESLKNTGKFANFNHFIKTIYIHLIENRLIEFYGYANAVDTFEAFIKHKNIEHFKRFTYMAQGLLDFSIKLKKSNALLEIFYKFNDFFFKDINEQLKQIQAKAIKHGDSIQIVCTDKKLITYRGNFFKSLRDYEKSTFTNKSQEGICQNYEEILKWNGLAKEFLKMYLLNFSCNVIERMPFSRQDKNSKDIKFDQNLLDITWLTDRSVRLLGIKTEVVSFEEKMSSFKI